MLTERARHFAALAAIFCVDDKPLLPSCRLPLIEGFIGKPSPARPGQLLIELDTTDYRIAERAARADFAQLSAPLNHGGARLT